MMDRGGIAYKMMVGMGWDGGGLGARGEGVEEAVRVRKRDGREGIGVNKRSELDDDGRESLDAVLERVGRSIEKKCKRKRRRGAREEKKKKRKKKVVEE